MKPLGNEIDHYWMLTDMAAATRTGLVAAWQDGRLSEEDWAEMVLTCRACRWATACRDWLDKVGTAEVPPAMCANRDTLARLKAERLAETA